MPILMTAAVTALGLMPLAIGMNQPGQEIEGPMAVTVLGGLLSSTLLNLVVLPALAERFGGPKTGRGGMTASCFLPVRPWLLACLQPHARRRCFRPAIFRPPFEQAPRRQRADLAGRRLVEGLWRSAARQPDRHGAGAQSGSRPGGGAAAAGRCAGAPGRRGPAAHRGLQRQREQLLWPDQRRLRARDRLQRRASAPAMSWISGARTATC